MKKSLIPLFLIMYPVFIFAQTKEELEFTLRSIKGDFKITRIDSSKHFYTINALNESSMRILILQKKLKRKEYRNLNKESQFDKLVVGKSYYFNLENWFYNFAIVGSPNDQIIIDDKIIYDKQTSPYFVYETINLKGIYYLPK
ncbi:hypothetical protein K6T82_18080 [Flavobacterium sp. 17A]|uniref:Uncharacterized protein n=1 Tax=Flavobacterium potami TaxID=2872310 RepID=A0A9X1KRP9_9FLAO|nr:hypothetical protein [Flavobacterium potami]MBZ4036684.1 hypothetical protein [Flavobacterium potami]